MFEEAGEEHPEAAKRRLQALSGMSLLTLPETVDAVAEELLRQGALPQIRCLLEWATCPVIRCSSTLPKVTTISH